MPKKANTASSFPCQKCKAPGSEQRRNGTQAGRQRWQCKACKKTWTEQPQVQAIEQDTDQDDDWGVEFNPECFRKLAEYYATPEGKKAMKAMGF